MGARTMPVVWFFIGMLEFLVLAASAVAIGSSYSQPPSERTIISDDTVLIDPQSGERERLGPSPERTLPPTVSLLGRHLLLLGDATVPSLFFDGASFIDAGTPEGIELGTLHAVPATGDSAVVLLERGTDSTLEGAWLWSAPSSWAPVPAPPVSVLAAVRLSDGRVLITGQAGEVFVSDPAVTVWSAAGTCGRGELFALSEARAFQVDLSTPTVFLWADGKCERVPALEAGISAHLGLYQLPFAFNDEALVFGSNGLVLKWSVSSEKVQPLELTQPDGGSAALPDLLGAQVAATGPDQLLFVMPDAVFALALKSQVLRELPDLGPRHNFAVVAQHDGKALVVGGTHDVDHAPFDFSALLVLGGAVIALASIGGVLRITRTRAERIAFIAGLVGTAAAIAVIAMLFFAAGMAAVRG